MVLNCGVFNASMTALGSSAPTLGESSTVGWGGIDEHSRDNYYITSDSEPAKMGSSLGWLLQLDGDPMRNAFLNAPWVKAVMPIRPGKEEAAINWLKGVEGMNGITDDVIYHASDPAEVDVNGHPLEGQKLIDVLFDLAEKIKEKARRGYQDRAISQSQRGDGPCSRRSWKYGDGDSHRSSLRARVLSPSGKLSRERRREL